MEHLGAPSNWENVGQVYPRSLDFEVVSQLVRAASAPSNFATSLRLMAGHELLSEGFAKGQTGSSAMPHKMNSRSYTLMAFMQLQRLFDDGSRLRGASGMKEMCPVRWFVELLCLMPSLPWMDYSILF